MRSKWPVVEPDKRDVARNMKVELGKPEDGAGGEVVVRTDDRIRWVVLRHQLWASVKPESWFQSVRSHKGGVVKPASRRLCSKPARRR